MNAMLLLLLSLLSGLVWAACIGLLLSGAVRRKDKQ